MCVHGKGRPVDWVGATALFGSAEVIDKDHLISSVERCYTRSSGCSLLPSPPLTAHQRPVCWCAAARLCVWFVTLGIFYLVALGVDFNDLLSFQARP